MVEEDPDDEVYYRLGQADNHVPVSITLCIADAFVVYILLIATDSINIRIAILLLLTTK